jgi:NAD(P)-dependent dehydrogenase (short-subunit alcohol dehydrogenase family)
MKVLVTGGTSGLGLAMATALATSALHDPPAGLLGDAGQRLPCGDRDESDRYFLVAREVTPRMLAAGGGRIVNVSVSHSTMHRAGFVP